MCNSVLIKTKTHQWGGHNLQSKKKSITWTQVFDEQHIKHKRGSIVGNRPPPPPILTKHILNKKLCQPAPYIAITFEPLIKFQTFFGVRMLKWGEYVDKCGKVFLII